MNLLPWILATLLVVAVVGLVVVPWLRAGAENRAKENPWSMADIERKLTREYCLECGQRVESPAYDACPACGATRPAVWP